MSFPRNRFNEIKSQQPDNGQKTGIPSILLQRKKKKSSRQRKEDRIKEENKVVFILNHSDENGEEPESHVALTADFSPGGVRIMTPIVISVGDTVSLEVVLSDIRKVIQGEGIVRWVKRLYRGEIFEAGIEFTKFTAKDRLLILRHSYQRQI